MRESDLRRGATPVSLRARVHHGDDGLLDREVRDALRSLLPSALPGVCGLEQAARYVPGRGPVGGDWYDVFGLPSGQLCAVIGDVAGSGTAAAVMMGQVRSAVRAHALQASDPAEILDRLDRQMRHFDSDALVTVLCAVIDPSDGQVRASSAGHLPPVIAYPDRPAVLADIVPDAIIGMRADAKRHVNTLTLPPGAVLCLYTDGLVERRHECIDVGLARLRQAVTACDPETGCAQVMAAMADVSSPGDDIAMLMFRRSAATGAGSDGQKERARANGARQEVPGAGELARAW